ncbi:MAG: Hpt domain-containing protein [Pseudooceanicola sp.]|nr:Hpt domain-containing protein [Pseudooceanicola sp.]
MIEAQAKLPGLERIRARFLDMLVERLGDIDRLCDPELSGLGPREALEQVQAILHKIAGTAGTLGMTQLGDTARNGENTIISYLGTGKPGNEAVYRSVAEFIILAEETLDAED